MVRDLSSSPSSAGLSKSDLISQAIGPVDDYLKEIDPHDVVLEANIGSAAIDAAATYGKVVGHKAGLNMGDCLSCACSRSKNLPLPYKDNGFSETDLA